MQLTEGADPASADAPPGPPTLKSIFYLAAGAWAGFGLLSLLVAVDATSGLDHWLQRRVASAAPDLLGPAPWLRSASFDVARLGSLPVAVGVVVVVGTVFALWRHTLVPAILLGVSFFFVAATVGGLKDLYNRPEPYDRLGALGFSYPSGHAAVAAVTWGGAAAVMLLFAWRQRGRPGPRDPASRAEAVIAVVAVVVALGVSLAMIARSAHWVSDVAAGVVLGVAWLATVATALGAVGWLPVTGGWRRSAEPDVAVRAAEPVGVDK